MIDLTLIGDVKQYRDELSVEKNYLDLKRQEFEEEFKDQIRIVELAKDNVRIVETRLREAILAEFGVTGNKTPAPGCGVREVTAVGYDLDEATEWGLTHRIAVKLNAKEFEAVVKIMKPPPRVRDHHHRAPGYHRHRS